MATLAHCVEASFENVAFETLQLALLFGGHISLPHGN